MLARAHWYNTGMADSTQLVGGVFLAKALPAHHHTSTRGQKSPHWSTKEDMPGLGVLPMARVHRGVAVSGSPLRTELHYLGESGVGLLSDPHAWALALQLSYPLPTPSSTLHSSGRVRLGPSPPSKPFLPAAALGSCLYGLSPLSLLCPGKEEPVQ